MNELTVQPVPVRQALVLRLTGELAAATAGDTVQSLLAASDGLLRPSLLLFDLRDVTLLSAEGVRALRTVARMSASRGDCAACW